ncbi:MAG: guanylate kinase [Acidobacteriota bacterium]
MRRGILLVISAPSGSGKTTLVKALLDRVQGLEFSVSYTTRRRRPTERDGLHYHFISEEEFRAKIAGRHFLEWAEVHGNLYGTDRAETEAVRERGLDVLLDVDVQGADQVRQADPEAVAVFVLPPSFQVLARRLRGRRQDQPAAIERRLAAARLEVGRYPDYHYVIVNEDVQRSAELLRSILHAERTRPHVMENRVAPILDSFKGPEN